MHLDKLIRVLVVEDDTGFTNLMLIILGEVGLEKIQTATDFEEGLRYFESFKPDICILDIDLGKGKKNGIELAETIRTLDPRIPIIYLTSNYTDAYYEQTRHTRPSSFLNKELSRFKLHQALDIALMHPPAAVLPLAANVVPHITQSTFFFKVGDIYKSIPVDKVAYFFSDQKMNFARVEQRNFPTSVQLKTLEQEFSPPFIRIHKSYLVNVKFIEAINPGEATVLVNGESLPIGYAYRKPFFEQIHLLK